MKYHTPFFLLVVLLILILAAGCTGTSPYSSPSPAGPSTTGTGTGDIIVDTNVMDTILASSYLQMSNLDLNFIDFTITNPTDIPRRVTVESEIPGYTEKAINTVDVPAHETITGGQTPTLRRSAIPSEMTSVMLHYKVALADGTLIDEQTIPVKIYAKDTMVWSVFDGFEWNNMAPLIAGWVTPHAAEIDPLVRKAADYHPAKSMDGYQCGSNCTDEQWEEDTNAQVKAIFTALKNDYQITYINSPLAYGKKNETPQRVRLPKDSLASRSANCIDGAVLYASALESLEINPHIIIMPNHAFVCYDTKPGPSGYSSCLETTMTGTSTFEEATDTGNQEYQAETTNGDFKSGNSLDLSIVDLRKEGILPME
ncbi:MAG: hypothetical protein NTV68_14560 [Methanomicrobiales archaeon]|nr:hypothetical protein [Methanomicrobiales archaeon]